MLDDGLFSEPAGLFIEEAADSGAVVVGPDLTVLRLDPLGYVESLRRPVAGATYYSLAEHTKLDDGTLLVVGSVESPLESLGFIAKLDAETGAWQAAQTIGCPNGRTRLSSVHRTFDSGHVVAGTSDCFGLTSSHLFVARSDASGDFLWQKTYELLANGQAEDEVAPFVFELAGGGYLVVAGTSALTGGASYDVAVLRLNNAGDAVDSHIRPQTSEPRAAVQLAGGQVLADLSSGWTIRLDTNGNYIWYRNYLGLHRHWHSASNGHLWTGAIVASPDLVFGVAELDSDGFTLSAGAFAQLPLGWSHSAAACSTSDGGYLAVGREDSSGQAFVLRLDGAFGLGSRCPQEATYFEPPFWDDYTEFLLVVPEVNVAAVSLPSKSLDLPVERLPAHTRSVCSSSESCSSTMPRVRGLQAHPIASKSDVRLVWERDLTAEGYNLWTVDRKEDVELARQASSPPAAGVVDCSYPAPASSNECIDRGAVARFPPLLYYQVRAFCDSVTEGP